MTFIENHRGIETDSLSLSLIGESCRSVFTTSEKDWSFTDSFVW